jgi:condensin-2 complex subunit G2
MQDASMGNQAIEELLTMQLTQAMKALRDPSPKVREAAASGACHMLTTWWELLPHQASSKLMVLLQESAFDSGAPRVRIALLIGLKDLVNNPLV